VSERTYTNPIHDGYLGDPFVLEHNGEYYAYGTVPFGDLTIPVLHSRDLTGWRPLGDALALDDAFETLWAPEVAYDNGVFYMYYSAGGAEGQGHRLRVATAPHPAGPFEDSGEILTPDDPFTIDAHPFRDGRDGEWYLYYCRDFLDPDGEDRVGTGIVVDRLVGMTRLAGERRMVVRPRAEWQIFERQRHWYGRVWDWYTVEGPFVREHDGRYYCFYSGGAWEEPGYGVGYWVADDPMGPFAPEPGAEGPRILRTRPGLVIGPGHASIARAPDNASEYLVYHAWDPEHAARLMRMDRLDWSEGRPSSPGPTLGPQPAPPLPLLRDGFDGPDGAPPDPGAWRTDGGDWKQGGGELVQYDAAARPATALLTGVPHGEGYLFEANVRLGAAGDERGRYGLCLDHGGSEDRTVLALTADGSALLYERRGGEDERAFGLETLDPRFESRTYHRLQVRVLNGEAEMRVDGVRVAAGLPMPPADAGSAVGLLTWGVSAAFDGVSLATGVFWVEQA
jgi:GH43 family beta-xylosidase